jgi:NADH-quinone oxidoreductase subunit J
VVVGLGGATNPPPESEALAQFSDPQTLGALLFTDYLLPFEVTGFILLIAVIGVVVLNQRGRKI